MADTKITALTENTTPLSTDILPMVDDPSGTPVTQKITIQNLSTAAPFFNFGKAIMTAKFNLSS